MRRLPLLCAFLLLTGCYDSRFGERSGGEEPEPATATIAQLRQLYAGTTFVIATDVVVSGRVNTSDAEENFYRTFCVEEDGAGLEVMAGIDHLHNDFPPGSRVTLRLKGLALGESRGILQVGRKPAAGSGFATDYLGSKAALDAAASRTGEAPQPVAPALLTIAELTPKRCGTLVRIDGLSYTPEDLTPGTWGGVQTLHRRRRSRNIHLCPQLRRVRRRRGPRRKELFAHGHSAIRRRRQRPLPAQTPQ